MINRTSIDMSDPSQVSLEPYQSQIKVLSDTPSHQLSAKQIAEVLKFEESVMNLALPAGISAHEVRVPNTAMNLEDIEATPVGEKLMCIDFLDTDNAKQILQKYLSMKELEIAGKNTLLQYILHNAARIEPADLEAVENESNKYVQQVILNNLIAIQKGQPPQPDPILLTVLVDPTIMMQKAESIHDLNNYYADLKLAIYPDDLLGEHKLLMIGLHHQKLIFEISRLHTQAQEYRTQIRYMGAGKLKAETFLVRLEQLLTSIPTNPVRKEIKDVDITNEPLLSEALQYLSPPKYQVNKQSLSHFTYDDVDQNTLDNTYINTSQLSVMATIVLKHYNLLSNNNSQDDKMNEPASDHKWRILIKPIPNLRVNGRKKILYLPENFNRRLNGIYPAGAMAVLEHELTHIFQHENNTKLGIALLARTKAVRSAAWFEAGAKYQEYQSKEALFGQIKNDINLTYIKAYQKKLEGGGITDCALAFYNEYIQQNPTTDHTTANSLAISRTLRLFRYGSELVGNKNCWADNESLRYFEADLLIELLPKNLIKYLFIGNLNLSIAAKLHQLGLLIDVSDLNISPKASGLLEDYVRTEILPRQASNK